MTLKAFFCCNLFIFSYRFLNSRKIPEKFQTISNIASFAQNTINSALVKANEMQKLDIKNMEIKS
jgi:hypothetical protein